MKRVAGKRIAGLAIAAALVGMAATGAWAQDQGAAEKTLKTAVFAGGCFWCMEPPFDKLDGVVSTVSGYTGGSVPNPTYPQVSAGGTGHAEVVQVTYDPARVGYDRLLEVYWRNVDPFDAGGQFCDRGDQYRAAIFPLDEEQKAAAERSRKEVEARLGKPIVTTIEPPATFYPAEAYHQNYHRTNPLRYHFYRSLCGRDQRLESVWGAEPTG